MKKQSARDISIKDIADKAEYSKGNLYGYFGSKDEILVALQYISLRLWSDIQSWTVTHHTHNLVKLGYIGETRRMFMDNYPIMYNCNNLSSIIDYSNLQNSIYMPELMKAKHSSDMVFRQTIKMGIEKGEIRDFVKPETLICLLESFSEGVFAKIEKEKKHKSGYCDQERLHEDFIEFVGGALRTDDSIKLKLDKDAYLNEMQKNFSNDNSIVVNRYII